MQSPGDVLSCFPNIGVSDIPTPLVILLLTPSFAAWLNDGQTFVHDALAGLFCENNGSSNVDVLAAVVDCLPSPSTGPSPVIAQRLGDVEDRSLPGGREGIAFLVGDAAQLAAGLWSADSEEVVIDTMTMQQRSTLSFRLRPGENPSGTVAHGLVPRPQVDYEIELPLANTIFRNGRDSTMFASRWTRSEDKQRMVLTKIKTRTLQHQRILIPVEADESPHKALSLDAPLLTLTVPRMIASAMGNIVRQLYRDIYGSETLPASHGLEQAVMEFLDQGGKSPQQVAVWALVTPKERWLDEPTASGTTLLNMLERGSRLHRVLSGGGGYGKKQGLLSLDPDAAYDLRTRSSPFGTGEDLDQEGKDALGQVAKPGDVIQFFVFPPELLPAADDPLIESQGDAPKMLHQYAEINFGTIPSTIDLMPSPTREAGEQLGDRTVEYRPDHFGALSEQGLSLTIETHGPKGMGSIGAERLGRVVQSKLDVPFTRFRLRQDDVQGNANVSLKD